jgi:hypothetical protein
MMEPTRMINSADSRSRFRCGSSLSRPITWVAIAPIRRLRVSIHCSVPTETPVSWDMAGTSSMPSELTIAVESAA